MEWSITKSEKLLSFLKERVDRPTKALRWLVEHNRCRVNGEVERFCSRRLFAGDRLRLYLDDEKKKLTPLFEDEYLIAYEKPAGFPSERLPHLLVHRLDRDTTGVIVCAKNVAVQEALTALFRKREIEKEYRALVSPPPSKERGKIEMEMGVIKRRQGAVLWGEMRGGLKSSTTWEVVRRMGKRAEVRLFPKSGRTHQLRVHMQAMGSPIVGDVDYGSRVQGRIFRPLLHARRLTFLHPVTGEKITITSEGKLC